MSGWWVVVDSRSPAERDASEDKLSFLLASWEAGPYDMRFLDDLVNSGKAKKLKFNGYPNRYLTLLEDLVPFIIDGPPCNHGFVSKVEVKREKIKSLPLNHQVTIDVWDNT